VEKQRASADFMEDFRALALEAGAFAGRHDDDCEVLIRGLGFEWQGVSCPLDDTRGWSVDV
jgi:hypothetical protein